MNVEVDGAVSRKRVVTVLLAAAALVVAAALGAMVLLRANQGEDEGTTWNTYEVEEDTQVTVYKLIRPCDEVMGADVAETAERVEVTLHINGGGMCNDSAVEESATVALSEPLNDREVYDAACLGAGRSEQQCLGQVRE